MSRLLFIYFLSLLISFSLSAQSDSLYLTQQLQKVQRLAYPHPDSAELILEEMLRFSIEKEYEWGLMVTHSTLGIVKFNQRDAESSFGHLQTALKSAEKLDDDRAKVMIWNNLGNYYLVKDSVDRALKFYLASAELEAETKESDVATSYLNIALVYLNAENYEQAEAFLYKSLNSSARLPEQRSLHAYVNLANLQLKKGQYQQAITMADSALTFCEKLNVGESFGRIYSIQAQSLYNLGEAEEALEKINFALPYLSDAGGGKPELEAILIKAKVLNLLKRPLEAQNLLEGSFPSLKGTPTLWQTTLQTLAQSYEDRGKLAKSLALFKQQQKLQDSLREVKRKQEIDRLLVQYETREKESQIQRLKQEGELKNLKIERNSYVLGGVILISLLAVIIIMLFTRQKRFQAKQETLEAQLRWRRAQLNPHLFFNLLTAVRTLIVQGEAQKAGKSLSKFARLMRQTLEGSNQDLIPLEEEVKFLEDYIALAQLQYDFEAQISYHPEDLETEDFFIPSMLLQPFVENAIEHGLGKSSHAHKLLEILFIEKNERTLQVIVRDNGVGRSETAKKSGHRSRATQITEERQGLMKDRFHFSIIDLKDTNDQPLGTEVRFKVKQ